MLEEFNEERRKTEANINAGFVPATIEIGGEMYISADEVKSVLEGVYCSIFATRLTVGEAYDYAQIIMREATDINSVDHSLSIAIGVYQNTLYRALMDNLGLKINDDVSQY